MRSKARAVLASFLILSTAVATLYLWPQPAAQNLKPCTYNLEQLGPHDFPELMTCDELHAMLISQLNAEASEARQKAQERADKEKAAQEAKRAQKAATEARRLQEREHLTPTLPLLDPSTYWITSTYGVSEEVRGWVAHDGLDMAVSRPDIPAVAQLDAEVLFAGDASETPYSGCGWMVGLYYTSADVTALYCHLSAVNTSPGATVPKGATVGVVGSSGLSTGPHLHYMTVRGRNLFDPAAVFNPQEWTPLEK